MPKLVSAAAALGLAVAWIAAWMRYSAREQALTGLLDLSIAVDVISPYGSDFTIISYRSLISRNTRE